ncbi:helix-turn-helix domain-containing protein [Actinomadura sp. NPDC048394]|uniref:PucR family transcriptional regulator n=1 Tax=Actinomadura sp. NPDC048394 TaxID=3158223 RepID=UPI0033D70EDF
MSQSAREVVIERDRVRQVAADLAARCEGQVNRLARELTQRRFAAIPDYADLPADMRDVEIAATARYAIRQFLRMAEGAPVDEDDLRLFRERAAQRAEEGMPLANLLASYYIGAEVIWDALVAEARPDELAALPMLARLQLRGTNRVVVAVTEAYQAERAAILDERREAVREVARALLAGEPARATADRFGIPLADAYLVLHLRFAGAGDGQAAGATAGTTAGAGIAERRVLRRIRAGLEGFGEGAPLMLQDERGVHVLLPSAAAARLADLERLLTAAGTAAGPVIAGAARSEGTADVPDASRRAARIAGIAQAAGRPAGVYELGDVLLDYHLSGPGDSGPAVGAALDPLDAHPELLDTLRAFLDADMDRRRAAAALAVHPNTVDNRLARIARLTGADPRTTRGVLLCAAALTLRGRGGRA